MLSLREVFISKAPGKANKGVKIRSSLRHADIDAGVELNVGREFVGHPKIGRADPTGTLFGANFTEEFRVAVKFAEKLAAERDGIDKGSVIPLVVFISQKGHS